MAPVQGDCNWFENAFGFKERKFPDTQKQFRLEEEGTVLVSIPNDRRFHVGKFDTPSVEELRAHLAQLPPLPPELGGINFGHVIGNARTMHYDPANAGAVFQVASQFNCLEMVGPGSRPEDGITNYAMDHTQGPACAIACPAGTAFRNYMVGGGKGQAGKHQLDLLGDVGALLGNTGPNGPLHPCRYWHTQNGYCMPTEMGSMAAVSKRLLDDPALTEAARSKLRIGCHWDTEVTKRNASLHRVCQVFCSAVPVAYTKRTARSKDWEPFARLVLEAAYEATLLVAASLAHARRDRVPVYLTALGGGAFGNRTMWIADAMDAAVGRCREQPLDVRLVHFSSISSSFQRVGKAARKGGRPSAPPAPAQALVKSSSDEDLEEEEDE